MITKELAEKLINAGFPKDKCKVFYTGRMIEATSDIDDSPTGLMVAESYYAPNLEELIEACEPQKADDFGLRCFCGEWQAYLIYVGYFEGWSGIKRDDDGCVAIDCEETGSTPSGAVANLWLKLNEKDLIKNEK